MDAAIASHCAGLNRCNQRGGRMLSVFDLIEAGTLDIDTAAYCMARITRGASFMVGARPGGAGKTTVMCALLNFLPADVEILAATPQAVHAPLDGRRCYVCHEIGTGPYFAYLWGRNLRAYCALGEQRNLLATNLHADGLEEARDQVCGENGVPEAHFETFDLLLFLRVFGSWGNQSRRVAKIYTADGLRGHTLLEDPSRGRDVDIAWRQACRAFLEETYTGGVRTIERTRRAVLAFLANCAKGCEEENHE